METDYVVCKEMITALTEVIDKLIKERSEYEERLAEIIKLGGK